MGVFGVSSLKGDDKFVRDKIHWCVWRNCKCASETLHRTDGEGLRTDLALLERGHQFLQRDVLLLQLRVVLEQPGLPELVLLDLLPHPAPLQLQHLVTLEQRENKGMKREKLGGEKRVQ